MLGIKSENHLILIIGFKTHYSNIPAYPIDAIAVVFNSRNTGVFYNQIKGVDYGHL